ncbi:2224_t:CDS:2 [Diversispora eburnea]|uniref:2224_t:CDS:1 n=1 Tax=Diversispora eburnea TaxID=1213867 RepID=A0A9N9G5M7_9GLOM|nr:2224_t:CDS:2 [Diversispora eburnea]
MEFPILENRNWIIYRVGGAQLFLVNRNDGSYIIPVAIRNINFESTPNFESYLESNFVVNSFLTNHIVTSNEQKQKSKENYDNTLSITNIIFKKTTNIKEIFKNFRRILQDENNIEEETILIVLNNSDNLTIDIFNWIQKCDNITLLNKPKIRLMNKFGIDTGELIYDIMQIF